MFLINSGWDLFFSSNTDHWSKMKWKRLQEVIESLSSSVQLSEALRGKTCIKKKNFVMWPQCYYSALCLHKYCRRKTRRKRESYKSLQRNTDIVCDEPVFARRMCQAGQALLDAWQKESWGKDAEERGERRGYESVFSGKQYYFHWLFVMNQCYQPSIFFS